MTGTDPFSIPTHTVTASPPRSDGSESGPSQDRDQQEFSPVLADARTAVDDRIRVRHKPRSGPDRDRRRPEGAVDEKAEASGTERLATTDRRVTDDVDSDNDAGGIGNAQIANDAQANTVDGSSTGDAMDVGGGSTAPEQLVGSAPATPATVMLAGTQDSVGPTGPLLESEAPSAASVNKPQSVEVSVGPDGTDPEPNAAVDSRRPVGDSEVTTDRTDGAESVGLRSDSDLVDHMTGPTGDVDGTIRTVAPGQTETETDTVANDANDGNDGNAATVDHGDDLHREQVGLERAATATQSSHATGRAVDVIVPDTVVKGPDSEEISVPDGRSSSSAIATAASEPRTEATESDGAPAPVLAAVPARSESAPATTAVSSAEVLSDAASRPAGLTAVATEAMPDVTAVTARDIVNNAEITRPVAADPSAVADDTAEELWGQVQRALQRIRTGADGTEIRVRLRPAELGELIVQVRTTGDQFAVRLITTSAAAHQTLLEDQHRLMAELRSGGFDGGTVDVSQQGQAQDGTDRRSTGQWSAPTGRDAATRTSAAFDRSDADQPATVRPRGHSAGLVDLTL